MLEMSEILNRAPILPVLVIHELEKAVHLARSLVSGGLPVLEVTLRTDAAFESIARIKKEVPGVLCGAGTVTHTGQVPLLKDVGADFAVSPGYTQKLGNALGLAEIPFLPGVSTASELMVGLDCGYSHFKFFPAEAMGGVKTLKSLGGPFPDARFCPTGGVTQDNLADYLAVPSVVSVGGSWVASNASIEAGAWGYIEQQAAQAVALVG